MLGLCCNGSTRYGVIECDPMIKKGLEKTVLPNNSASSRKQEHVEAGKRRSARNADVPVIFDAGGIDAPIPQELLDCVDIFSPNESELGRLTGMPTESFEDITQAALKCHEWVSSSSTVGIEQWN
ncbi:ribokinase-like [Vicia villosa]|uniref:ribokinase-like n=1 Tax=Vicia villosa TaxID=3911 RepID=UPI00273C86F6|nr:ribokinase-like [Vicia villosa]